VGQAVWGGVFFIISPKNKNKKNKHWNKVCRACEQLFRFQVRVRLVLFRFVFWVPRGVTEHTENKKQKAGVL